MKLFRNSLAIVTALAALVPAQPLFAQNCVLCYTSAVAATGGNSAAIRGLLYGILALLTPALVLFTSIFVMILRRARAANRAENRCVAPAPAAHCAAVAPRPAFRLLWFRPSAPARN